jgi:thiamine-phosphate pyrophosphorylase
MNSQRAVPRLYLVTPLLEDTSSFVGTLDAALDAGDVAAVLLRLADADEGSLTKRAKAVASAVQRRDIALLLDGRSEMVGRAGADGAHITGIEAFAAALSTLKPDRIAGAGGLRSRHDAMLAGETGADYVMFGDPAPYPPPHAEENHPPPFPPPRAAESWVGGHRPPFDTIEERLKWWADLIEIPCVGYAASADEVRPLAQAGADFVALGDWIWTHTEGAAAAVAAAVGALAEPPP